jgi:glycosyltransferase involved in cell wall biosynthesis
MAIATRDDLTPQLGLVADAPLRGDAPRRRASSGRERIAILSTWHPEPVDNGRKQRTRQMIAALAERYDVALISLLPAHELEAGAPAPVPGVWQQWALPLPVFETRAWPALLAAAHPWPRSIVATWSARVARRIDDLLVACGVRLAIGTDLRTLRYLLALDPTVSTVLDEPDVSPFVVAGGVNPLGRLRSRSRREKYRRLLGETTTRLGATVVASTEEAQAYRTLSGAGPIAVIENGIAALPTEPWRPTKSGQLLYTGSLTYRPNVEAVAYFAEAIWPRLSHFPEIELVVTGTRPERQPAIARHPAVRLTGWLAAADLAATYRAARACVVPLQSGTGTRIKILEALAYGIPVVTTSKGAEGLSVVDGEHLVIADSPADFAAATLRIIRDDEYAAQLGVRGREFVCRHCSWETRGAQLRELVGRVLDSAPRVTR